MNGSQLKQCGYERDETIPEPNDEKANENLFIRDESGGKVLVLEDRLFKVQHCTACFMHAPACTFNWGRAWLFPRCVIAAADRGVECLKLPYLSSAIYEVLHFNSFL